MNYDDIIKLNQPMEPTNEELKKIEENLDNIINEDE